jgi:hypothetical protein
VFVGFTILVAMFAFTLVAVLAFAFVTVFTFADFNMGGPGAKIIGFHS